MTTPLYLRQNVQVEPLIESWYAWSHLISPATAAMNIVDRHLKIMQSYVQSPQVHAAAVKNPAMLGGPFIDYDGKRVDEIQALLEKTKRDQGQMIAFSDAIKQLDQLLRLEAKGFSLEPLYAKVPEILRGYVELVYDLNNQPSFRLVEPLLYRSPFYDPSRQSLMLSLITSDDRPFILSTPRLRTPGDVHVVIPFESPVIDELFAMKWQPGSVEAIAEKLGVTIIMELLNSKRDHGDYQCDRTPWGVELVNAVASDRFRLLYDIYHMQIMEGDVIATIQKHHKAIGHYHTAGNPGRNEFDDTQELNYKGICAAIVATGYKGYLGQEFMPKREAMASLREAFAICDV